MNITQNYNVTAQKHERNSAILKGLAATSALITTGIAAYAISKDQASTQALCVLWGSMSAGMGITFWEDANAAKQKALEATELPAAASAPAEPI